MEYRQIPEIDTKVSRIGFGAASISGEGKGYGFGAINTQDSIDLLKRAADLGMNLFDTAPIYGFGLSEQRIGKALKEIKQDIVVVSKAGVTWDDNKRVDICNDPKVTQKMLEQSLRDLQLDCIDVYMIHWPDPRNDIRKSMEVIAKAKEQGKVKAIGLCNTFLEDFEKASEIAEISVLQDNWNPFTCKDTYDRIAPIQEKKRHLFMGYGSLDKGILTQRVDEKRKFDEFDARSSAPWWKNQDLNYKLDKVKKLSEKTDDLLQFALSFSQHHLHFCDVSLVGARNLKQLESLVEKDLLSFEKTQEIFENVFD